jgi:hypothetical protein
MIIEAQFIVPSRNFGSRYFVVEQAHFSAVVFKEYETASRKVNAGIGCRSPTRRRRLSDVPGVRGCAVSS